MSVVRLTRYREAREAFRHRDLRQALYDEGRSLMGPVIVNLHGDEHRERRRLENRLFTPETFGWYERDHIPRIIDAALDRAVAAGTVDLLPLARDTMLRLSVDVAGIDLDDDRFPRFAELMARMARAATVTHATGDHTTIVRDGDAALDAFRVEFFEAAHARRRALVAAVDSGEADVSTLPRDVLTTLLRNQDRLDLPDSTVLREVAYYPWVGAHSTAAQLVHAMHHLFEWLDERPDDRARLIADDAERQRFVHESMRLHPASPVARRIAVTDVELSSGVSISSGTAVTIDVETANRDPDAVGPRPDEFDPDRPRADDVPPWGLSFGSGFHACLGRALAGGIEPGDSDRHLLGAVTVLAGRLLASDARPDPGDPATLDAATTRTVWGRYPVEFRAAR